MSCVEKSGRGDFFIIKVQRNSAEPNYLGFWIRLYDKGWWHNRGSDWFG